MTKRRTPVVSPAKAATLSDVERINESLFPSRTPRLSRRVVIALAVLSASLLFTGLFLYQAQAQTIAPSSGNTDKVMSVSAGKAYLGAQTPLVPAARSVQMLGINIANNGLVLLRGARVTAISGGIIYVEMKWNVTGLTWTIKTNLNTKFLTPAGERQSLTDIQVGNIVNVTGQLIDDGTGPVISAQFVREG